MDSHAHRRPTVAVLIAASAAAVISLAACSSSGSPHASTPPAGSSTAGSASPGSASAARAAETSTPSAPTSSCGTAAPSGTYAGPVSATIINTVGGQRATAHLSGRITLVYTGRKVTGSVALAGSGSGPTGAEGGTVTGRVGGAQAAPTVTGTAAGTGGNSPFTVALHVTKATCSAVSGDLVAMFRSIYAYYRASSVVTISGAGAWTIPRI